MIPMIDPPREDASPEQLTGWIRRFVDEYNMLLDMFTGGLNTPGNAEQTNDNGSFLKSLILAAHPVGSYYWSDNPADPAALFGGKWERVKGQFLFAADDLHAPGSTGGKEKVQLSSTEIPKHEHAFPRQQWFSSDSMHDDSQFTIFTWDRTGQNTERACIGPAGTYGAFGGDPNDPNGAAAEHENMPPYVAAYCWKRTA